MYCILHIVKGRLQTFRCLLSGLLLDLLQTRYLQLKGLDMARITSQKAAIAAGGLFDLVLVASQRAREIRRGSPTKAEPGHGPVVSALKEIEDGHYTKEDYLRTLVGKRK